MGEARPLTKARPGGMAAAVAVQDHPAIRMRTLVAVRWTAIAGQLFALGFVRFYLEFPVHLAPPLLLVAASAGFNLFLLARYPPTALLSPGQAGRQLAFDLLQLAALLYFTGGLSNPFAMLMVAPVSMAATILRRWATAGLLALALVCLLLLGRFHEPLPWAAEPLILAPTYLLGVWTALAVTLAFMATYAARLSREAQNRARALEATQAALAREQKLSALGGLAAAAAHELGTPLGTITLVAKDLLREHGNDTALGDDLALLASQAARCRDILANLSRRAQAEDPHFRRMPADALLREIARPLERPGVEFVHTSHAEEGGGPTPVIARHPEILHALANFIDNAARFARARVDIDISWDADMLHLVISDDGPGFDADIIDALGEPYLRSGSKGSGMGLGVFIAKTLLERTGATLAFMNDVEGGAVVDISWPRAAIEEEGEAWTTTMP
ncbi:MAG: ActS/PrrB/RegB family redox-sensitive histidine kinase [Sphingomonadales bacterium]